VFTAFQKNRLDVLDDADESSPEFGCGLRRDERQVLRVRVRRGQPRSDSVRRSRIKGIASGVAQGDRGRMYEARRALCGACPGRVRRRRRGADCHVPVGCQGVHGQDRIPASRFCGQSDRFGRQTGQNGIN